MKRLYGVVFFFLFRAKSGMRASPESRGLGDVYKKEDGKLVSFNIYIYIYIYISYDFTIHINRC